MSSFISYFNDRMPDVLNRLLTLKGEIEKVQSELGRLLIMSQDPKGYFSESEQDENEEGSMELLILVTGDKIKQVPTLNDAACMRFLVQSECRLFRFDTNAVTVEELEIPVIEFVGTEAIEGG